MSDFERYLETRRQAAIQIDQDLYRQSPALWWLVAILTALIRPWASLRYWWENRSKRG